MPVVRIGITYPTRCARRIPEERLLAVLQMPNLSDEEQTDLIFEIFEDKGVFYNKCSFRVFPGNHINMYYGDLNHRDRLLVGIVKERNIILNEESLKILANYVVNHNAYAKYDNNDTGIYSEKNDYGIIRETYMATVFEAYLKIISQKELDRDFLWDDHHISFIMGAVNKCVADRENRKRQDTWRTRDSEPYLGKWKEREINLFLSLCSNPNLSPVDCEKIYFMIKSSSLRKEVMSFEGIFPHEEIKVAIALYESSPYAIS